MKTFDLNVKKVLEQWGVEHAVRELIANALDEQLLTQTSNIMIYADKDNTWHIRDFGRGLREEHFVQNENPEKLSRGDLIGKFGVGLKDALATLYRYGVQITIDSKYMHMVLRESKKHGFDDIKTLHAFIDAPLDESFEGTEISLEGCTAEQIEEAKAFFVQFTDFCKLEETEYGTIMKSKGECAEIFFNGLKVAEDEEYMFSYNITNLTKKQTNYLNRERTNVGRTAYTTRIKDILKHAQSNAVFEALNERFRTGDVYHRPAELKFEEVLLRVSEYQVKKEDTVFISSYQERTMSESQREIIKNSGKRPVYVSHDELQRLEDSKRRRLNQYTASSVLKEYEHSLVYDCISYEDLTDEEKQVFDLSSKIIKIMHSGVRINQIKISESIKTNNSNETVNGLWDPHKRTITICRYLLCDPSKYCGVLIHELLHADTGFDDITRAFETELTKWAGVFAFAALHLNDL